MLRRAAVALIAGAGGALLAPSGLLAADSPAMTPAPGAPVAVLDAAPDPVQAGRTVRLDASRSSDPSDAIVHFTWDLDGNGSYELDTGAHPYATVRLTAPGPARIGVRVVDGRGAAAEAHVDVEVIARPRPRDRPPPGSAGEPAASASGPGPTVPGPAAGGAAPSSSPKAAARSGKPAARHSRKAASVRAAASGGVTIQNFKFQPGTTNLKVGDTVTWTNQDSASHTATASDGSFNTGVLKQGQSGSHTFTKAGTFAYLCAIHPFMKGTVVVAAASTGGGGSSPGASSGSGSGSTPSTSSGSGSTSGSSGSSGSTGSTGSSGSSGSSLPHTGLELIWVLALGAAMTLGGAFLRRRTHR